MGYCVTATCDDCGRGFKWNDRTVSYTAAQKVLRFAGYRAGKGLWLCPDCKKKEAEEKARKRESPPKEMFVSFEKVFGAR